MKKIVCSLLARILFNQSDFDFLEYSGLNFDPGSNCTDHHVQLIRVAVEVES